MTTAAAASERPPVGIGTKLVYSVGAIANAVKMRAISTFLLIFYNQVIGLDASVVATIIMITLFFDAVVDPTIGQISDNFRSPWGRRHPFMYAAALPVAVLFFLLWNPPANWSPGEIALYLLVVLIGIRFFDTFFELPASALLPELVGDYDKRTDLYTIRMFFAALGGLGMTVAAYQYFMAENPDGSGGVLSREGYFDYALVGALIIFAAIMICTLGTHRQIPYLHQAPARRVSIGAMIREVGATISNRSYIVAVLSGVFTAVASGVKNGLDIYWGLYFFEFTQAQIAGLATIGVVAAVTGVVSAPFFGRWLGKKRAAIWLYTLALAIGVTPILFRLLGIAPANHTAELYLFVATETFINGAFAAATGVMLVSMMADVVEDAAVKTGRRSEGLLFSADNFFKKAVSGVGVFTAGLILTIVSFPTGARRGQVDPDILTNLALIYLPIVVVLYGTAIGCLFLFRIDKQTHEENLRRLRSAPLAAD